MLAKVVRIVVDVSLFLLVVAQRLRKPCVVRVALRLRLVVVVVLLRVLVTVVMISILILHINARTRASQMSFNHSTGQLTC